MDIKPNLQKHAYELKVRKLREKLAQSNSSLATANTSQLLRMFYPQLAMGAGRKRHDEILKNIEPSLILDAGCGRGWLSLSIFKRKNDVVAMDLSKNQIKDAKSLFEVEGVKIPLVRASLTHLPFKASIFDTIVSCDVIEHIPMIGLGFSEMNRILKQSGKLCLTTPNGYGTYGIFHDFILPKLGKGHKGIESEHVHRFTYGNLRRLISKSGFRILTFVNSEVLTPFFDIIFHLLKVERLKWQAIENKDVDNSAKFTPLIGGIWLVVCQKL